MKKILSIENLTLIAIILSVPFGIYFKELSINISFIGTIFLNLLKLVIVPLILSSVLVSILGLNSLTRIKEVGIKTLIYYMSTTTIAVITGLLIVNFFGFESNAEFSEKGFSLDKEISLKDFILSLIPSNPVESLAEGKVIQIIIFSILIGMALLKIAEDKRSVIFKFFDGLNDGLIVLTRWIIYLTPLGVFSIVSSLVAEKGIDPILGLWKYALAVFTGLLVHAVINLGLIAYLVGRFNPLDYFLKIREAVIVAFSTASSSATLPVSMEVAEEKGGVKKKTAGFVLPLGATINMDGTALYEAVAVLFIASIYGIELGLYQQIIVALTATLASIGAAGIPGAGLVTMVMVLNAVGLPLEGIGVILAVDRFLDMLRTSVNVWGDLVGTKVIDRFVK